MTISITARRVCATAAAMVMTTCVGGLMANTAMAQTSPKTDDAATAVPAYTLPFSGNASPEARAMFLAMKARPTMPATDLAARIRAEDAINVARVARLRQLFAVKTTAETIGGVQTDVVVPTNGIAPRNAKRVLINLHGGGFLWGARSGGLVESIPIAATGRIKVITVDYRMAPAHRFPAATEDVVAVYRALLKSYRPENIGIYGCSAGAVLTAQTIAWLDRAKMPLPGAIGTFCSSIVTADGDSVYRVAAESGAPAVPGKASPTLPYFIGQKITDPMIFPGNSPALVARFPPTLLITGTRDFAEGSVLQSHRLLTNAGVDAELHVWDGMWHSFLSDPDMPESREAYSVIARFFDRKLSRKPGR